MCVRRPIKKKFYSWKFRKKKIVCENVFWPSLTVLKYEKMVPLWVNEEGTNWKESEKLKKR